ncbi:hypothetical protein P2R40_12195, partial [Bacillus pseudomycoides]|nr:hypothetical protein [Bacillus pseudomycoides]
MAQSRNNISLFATLPLVTATLVLGQGICDALIKAKEEGIDAFTALDGVMPWNKIVESVEEAKQLSRPVNYDYLDLLETRYSYLRKYTPTLLQTFKFGATKSAEPVLQALETIHELNETGKRKVPIDANLSFVSNRWQNHVYDEEGGSVAKFL